MFENSSYTAAIILKQFVSRKSTENFEWIKNVTRNFYVEISAKFGIDSGETEEFLSRF